VALISQRKGGQKNQARCAGEHPPRSRKTFAKPKPAMPTSGRGSHNRRAEGACEKDQLEASACQVKIIQTSDARTPRAYGKHGQQIHNNHDRSLIRIFSP